MKKIHMFYVLIVVAVVVLILLLKAGENKPGHAQTETTGNNGFVRDEADMAPVQTVGVGATPSRSPSTSVLTLIDPDTDYEARLDAMSNLGYEIPTDDVATLINFLVAEIPADVKISRGAYNSVRNDLYEVLLRQKEMPEGMGNLLIDVVNNPDQDGMWRNYCIQFMPEFYSKAKSVRSSRAGLNTGGVDAELRNVQESMWRALEERDNSNAATALLGLEKLSRNHPEFDRNELDAAMLDLASDDQASVANRITAIRMCGERGDVQSLETARNLARNGDTTMLRCAAIMTVGEIGTTEDRELLEGYILSGDQRIAEIAKIALGTIDSR